MSAKFDQFVAVLYASTLAIGTCICVVAVEIAEVVANVGGVVASTRIVVKLLQPWKADWPIEVNVLGRVIEVKLLQYLKA